MSKPVTSGCRTLLACPLGLITQKNIFYTRVRTHDLWLRMLSCEKKTLIVGMQVYFIMYRLTKRKQTVTVGTFISWNDHLKWNWANEVKTTIAFRNFRLLKASEVSANKMSPWSIFNNLNSLQFFIGKQQCLNAMNRHHFEKRGWFELNYFSFEVSLGVINFRYQMSAKFFNLIFFKIDFWIFAPSRIFGPQASVVF